MEHEIKNIEKLTQKQSEELIEDFLDKYPWYKLEPDHIEKLRENLEVRKLFQKYLDALRSNDEQLVIFSLKGVKEFFTKYIKKNPKAYNKKQWGTQNPCCFSQKLYHLNTNHR